MRCRSGRSYSPTTKLKGGVAGPDEEMRHSSSGAAIESGWHRTQGARAASSGKGMPHGLGRDKICPSVRKSTVWEGAYGYAKRKLLLIRFLVSK